MADAQPGTPAHADDARRWLAMMPASVSGQRRLIQSLITAAEDEPAFRWLELGGSLARPWTPDNATADAATAREWACLGWVALGDVAKYLDRGSPWEARARLEEARAQAWPLWAVAIGAVYPAFGLTAVLDVPDVTLPPGLDATAAGLDLADIRRAAIALANLLANVTERAQSVLPFDGPDGLREWARARLTGASYA
jgi:hypothetical protein